MAVRRTCPNCGDRWAQRHARFCGSCGATLREPGDPPRPRRRKGVGWALVAAALVVLVVLVVLVTGLELTSPTPDPEVDLDPEAQEPTPSELPADEADQLRAQADPDALRCEPRGCEAWRLALADGQDGDLSVVSFPNRDVALLEEAPDHDGVRVVAMDPDTNGTSWALDLLDDADGPVGRLLLEPLGEHALVSAGLRLFAVDQDGEVVWTRDLSPLADDVDTLWQHLATEDLLLVAASQTTGPSNLAPEPPEELVAAVDPTDGEVLWSTTARRLALDPELVVMVDDDGHLTALDPSSGERLWTGPRIGDGGRLAVVDRWIVANDPEERMRLFRGEDGDELDILPADPITRPYAVDDDLVALVGTSPDPGQGSSDDAVHPLNELTLVRVAPDGSVRWSTEVGSVQQGWSCCLVDSGGSGSIEFEVDDERYEYALDTGELRSSESMEGDERGSWGSELPSGTRVDHSEEDRLTFRRDGEEVTVTGRPPLRIASLDPLAVTDGRHLLGIDLPPADRPAD